MECVTFEKLAADSTAGLSYTGLVNLWLAGPQTVGTGQPVAMVAWVSGPIIYGEAVPGGGGRQAGKTVATMKLEPSCSAA